MNINLADYASECEPRQKIIVSRDKRSRCEHRALNHNECLVRHFKIDGTVIKDSTFQRCDFLLTKDEGEKKAAYFIELKGSDIEHAIAQIENTVAYCRESLVAYKLFLRIIYSSGTHQIRGNTYIKWKQKYKDCASAVNRELTECI